MYYEVRRSEELHSETVSGNREENRANFIDSEEFTAVSYTHLDVYKRQVLTVLMPMPCTLPRSRTLL